MSRLGKAERDAIRAREQAATPGPWIGFVYEVVLHSCVIDHGLLVSRPEDDANVAFVEHAREDIPRLLDALDKAEKENERLLAMLAPFLGSNIPLVGEE